MRLYNKQVSLPFEVVHRANFHGIQELIGATLNTNERVVRFAITNKTDSVYEGQICVLEDDSMQECADAFQYIGRPFERSGQYTVAAIIPTGVCAAVGGDSGDAQAAMRLLSSVSDRLILHPNAVNGADIAEVTENMLYVEGSTLTRLFMGTIALLPTRGNRTLLLIDSLPGEGKYYTELAVNAASASRLGLGGKIDIKIIDSPPRSRAYITPEGIALGSIEHIDAWVKCIHENVDKYDAFAINSVIQVDQGVAESYFSGNKLTNPWGGIEAMMTHSLSMLANKPIAHSPLDDSDVFNKISLYGGIVKPAKASEVVSKTYLHCILKGLHRSPKIIHNSQHMNHSEAINASDINCLVIPDRCIGLPVLAALRQNIKVIAVADEENIIRNNLDELNWREGQFYRAANYVEAAGLIAAFKLGIEPETVIRPLSSTKIL